MLQPTFQAAVAVVGNQIVACGGRAQHTVTNVCQVYNPKENT